MESLECCCGCGLDASKSRHWCIHTDERIMAWCGTEKQPMTWINANGQRVTPTEAEKPGSKTVCSGCLKLWQKWQRKGTKSNESC